MDSNSLSVVVNGRFLTKSVLHVCDLSACVAIFMATLVLANRCATGVRPRFFHLSRQKVGITDSAEPCGWLWGGGVSTVRDWSDSMRFIILYFGFKAFL